MFTHSHRPRRLDIPGGQLPEVFVVRSPADANAVATAAAQKRVVVIGTSFIGKSSFLTKGMVGFYFIVSDPLYSPFIRL